MAEHPSRVKRMRRPGVLVAGLLSLPLSAAAQSDATQLICNCSDYLLSEQIRSGQMPPRAAAEQAREKTLALDKQALDTAFGEYRKTAEEVDRNRQFLAKEKRDIEMTTAMFSDLVPVAPVNMIEVQALWIVDQEIEANEKALVDSRKALVNGALGNLLRQNGEALDLARSGKGQEAFKALFGEESPQALLSTPELTEGLDEATRNEVDAALTHIVAENLTVVAQGLGETREDLAALRKEIGERSRRQEKFNVAVTAEFENIGESLDGLKAAYDKLVEDSKGNSWRLENIERIMFDDLSPRQKLEKLQSGQFASFMATMTPDAMAKLEKAKDVQTWRETATEWQSGLTGIVTIASNLGMDVGEAQSILNNAGTLVMGALSIYSGTPMGVIGGLSAISGVFGGGGQPADARVMAAIKALEQKIERWHLEEMEAIEKVATRIEEGFARSDALQQETLFLIDHISKSIANLSKEKVSNCPPAVENVGLATLDPKLFAQHRAQLFADCFTGLHTIFSGGQLTGVFAIHDVFKDVTSSVSADGVPTMIMLRHIIEPMLAYSRDTLSRRFPDCSGPQIDAVLMNALIADPRRDGAVRTKLDAIVNCAEVEPIRWPGTPQKLVTVKDNIETPINQLAVAEALGMVLATYPYMERIANIGGGSLYLLDLYPESTPADREAMKHRLDIAISHLRRAQLTGNVAIAQANLIIGDLVFEQMEEDLFALAFTPDQLNFEQHYKGKWSNCAPGTEPISRYWAAVCLLSSNRLLANNFARYLVRKHFVDGELTARTGYAFTLAKVREREVSVSLLDPMFDRKLPLVMRDDQNAVPEIRFPVGEHRFANPSPVLKTIQNPDVPKCQNPDDTEYDPKCRFATSFDLKGDILLELPDWGEAASTRQMTGSVDIVRVALALDQIEALIRNYEISLALPPDIRSMAQEAAVAAAWNP